MAVEMLMLVFLLLLSHGGIDGAFCIFVVSACVGSGVANIAVKPDCNGLFGAGGFLILMLLR